MSNKKVAAIAEILKMRDQPVVMRERLFQLTAATAARTKKVDGLLIDCAGAGRVFGVRIGLPDWNNVLAMPGHQFAHAQTVDSELLEYVEAGRELGAKIALPIWENVWKTSLLEEMRRVCAVSEWTRPEQAMGSLLSQVGSPVGKPLKILGFLAALGGKKGQFCRLSLYFSLLPGSAARRRPRRTASDLQMR